MTTILAKPTDPETTHHVRLYDDYGKEVGLVAAVPAGQGQYMPDIRGIARDPVSQTSIKVSNSPGTRHSAFERPYSYAEQVTWAAGRGFMFQPETPSGFYDSKNAWTTVDGQVLPAGLMHYGQGYRSQDMHQPVNVSWYPLIDDTTEGIAIQFTASASYTSKALQTLFRKRGTPASGLKVALHADNSDVIDTELASETLSASNFKKEISYLHKIIIDQGLTVSTKYWIAITSGGGTTTDCWLIGHDAAGSAQGAKHNGTTWSYSATQAELPYFRVRDADVKRRWHFFEYKNGLYTATEPENASVAPQIFLNGWRGATDDNSGDKTRLNDATQTGWTTAKLAGTVALLVRGPGAFDSPRYRKITAGSTGTATMESAWLSTHTTATEYVFRGSDWWNEITGHGMTSPVRGVTAPQDTIYFSLGNATNIRVGGEYNNAGVWTQRTWADDGDNKADFLTSALDQIDGMQVIRGLNSDSAGHVAMSRASAKAWGEKLQFASSIPIGDDNSHITNIIKGEGYLFILKEDAVYAVTEDSPEEVVNFLSFKSDNNGVAAVYTSPYLYFSLGRGGFERLLDRNMEDIGLWRGEGWDPTRHGPISCSIGTPQYQIIGTDGGADNFSSVFLWNGSWHEIFRAPETGQRIRSLFYDVTPGDAIDRLWIGMDSDLVWIPMPNVLNPYYDDEFQYTWEAVIVSSWIDEGTRDLLKYAKTMQIWCENFVAAGQYAEWDYQLDQAQDEDEWNIGTGTFDTVPAKTLDVKQVFKRFRYRLRLYTTDASKGPRMTAATIGLITNIPPKFAGEMTFLVDEEDGETKDMQGEPDGQSYLGIMAQLEAWASSPRPVHMECVDAILNGIDVIVMPTPGRASYLIETEASGHICSIRLQEA